MENIVLPHDHGNRENAQKYAEYLKCENEFIGVSDLLGVMADSSRLKIFWLLCHCEECVTDISVLTGMSSPAVSHHLKKLRETGLVLTRRCGKEVYYRAESGERAQLLHKVIEEAVKLSCPESSNILSAPHLLDDYEGDNLSRYPRELLDTVKALHDELSKNLSSRTTIEELAKKYHVNSFTLKKVFRDVYGNSIAAHIKEHRMEEAARLIEEGGDSIGNISKKVGYENSGKFTAEFKKHFGLLPTEYRKRLP